MASVTTDIFATRATESMSDKLMRGLTRLAKLSPTYRRVEALSIMTDAELAAQNMTREQAAARVFGNKFYI